MGRLRVLVADDNLDVLTVLRSRLEIDFEVVGTARDGVALIDAAEDLNPDVVITDISMPGRSGIEATREILRRKLCKAVVVLTIHSDPHLVKAALKAGVRAYVLKVNAGEELIPAVHQALNGITFVSPDIPGDW